MQARKDGDFVQSAPTGRNFVLCLVERDIPLPIVPSLFIRSQRYDRRLAGFPNSPDSLDNRAHNGNDLEQITHPWLRLLLKYDCLGSVLHSASLTLIQLFVRAKRQTLQISVPRGYHLF